MWLIVIAMLIGAGILFAWKKPLSLDGVAATSKKMPVACPTCGSFSTGGAPGAIVRCDCGTYARVEQDGTLATIDADFVAPTHAFQTFLPEAPSWPATCCLCGAPASKSEAMTITYAADPTFEEKLTAQAFVAVASLGTATVTKHEIQVTEKYRVPHCDQHTGGAQLAPAGVAFRSYAYYRQFVQANRGSIGS
jgi:hypothetical protein